MTDATPLPIDVVSDVVCPWCYIGKRFLEKAIALKPEIPVEVRFRPYFLNPWVPREGISREQYLITKFGSVERYNANSQRIVDAAAHAGLDYARDKIKKQPNTLDCHRLILWAGGNAAAMPAGRGMVCSGGDYDQHRACANSCSGRGCIGFSDNHRRRW